MKHWPLLITLGVLFASDLSVRAQVPPEKAEATFTVADGLEMKLWASEPLFVNPTCIDIDHKGRVWVCESVNYRHSLHHLPPRRPAGDRILILEDSRGVGKADKVTTFYQSKELLAPMGIAVAKDPVGPGYKVYVCQSPDILLFEDKDGDGKADGPPKKLLSGFRGIDHDHGVHGILIGPDGKLYFSVGDQGVQDLQSSDKKGRKWTTNHTDCQAGTIWRCDLDGKNLELIAHNFRNEYEPCVDSFGTIFVSDNDDDGNQQTRICYVMPGGNYGYWPRGPGQSHWHEEQPGVVPKILRTYFGSPTGMCVYEGTLLPKKYWGQLLHTDAGPRHVRCYHLKPNGAGYDVDREDMVTSTDNWFRPSDICVAPDGSVFVADWYDPGVGGHGIGDTTRGRIYRIAPKGNRKSVPTVDLESAAGLIAAVGSPALSVRHLGVAKLRSMKLDKAGEKLLKEICRKVVVDPGQDADPKLVARFSWVLDSSPVITPTVTDCLRALWGFDPKDDSRPTLQAIRSIRELISRRMRQGPLLLSHPATLLEVYSDDPRADVRREVLLSLRDVDPGVATPLITELAKQYDGKDRFYLEAIGIAVGQDQHRREVILADFDKHFPEWNDKVADLVWELRPPSVMPRLGKRLLDPSLPLKQRLQIVEILGGTNDDSGGQALIQALASAPPAEVRDRILTKLKQNLPGKWQALRRSNQLAETLDGLLAKPGTRPVGLALIGATGKKEAIGQLVQIARDGKEKLPIRSAAVHALGSMTVPAATQALQGLIDVEPAELRVAVAQALGEQLDIYASAAAPGMKILKGLIMARDRELAVRQAAGAALAGTQDGTEWLLNQAAQQKLPGDLQTGVCRLLRNSPFGPLRERALALFPAPKLDPKKLPDVALLVRRKGDAARGKQLMAASIKSDLQCLKCHTIHGVGGQVGPDLSVIGQKASRENLLESILLPSKAIADQYLTWVIETKKGVQVSGLLIEDTADHVTLRDANAKDFKIDKKDIESRTKSPNSLMPSDLLAYMTEDDVVDIVEYLLGLKTPSPAR
jgi:putative membrane-bound dehydrogenase-like protein